MDLNLPEHSPFRKVNVLKRGQLVTDYVIAEEPLEIRVCDGGKEDAIATTMRTPGSDAYLALGYLKSEGLLSEILGIHRPLLCEGEDLNCVVVRMKTYPHDTEKQHQRLGVQSSSCGLCGMVSIESILGYEYPTRSDPQRRWNKQDFQAITEQLEISQELFLKTGGSHGVWLFDRDNQLVKSFEDVGRHNALDKLLGWLEIHPVEELENMTLILSSRLSYELVHKAAVLGVQVIASVGAPSSLAVELANKLHMSAVGFLWRSQFNIYTNKRALIFDEE